MALFALTAGKVKVLSLFLSLLPLILSSLSLSRDEQTREEQAHKTFTCNK